MMEMIRNTLKDNPDFRDELFMGPEWNILNKSLKTIKRTAHNNLHRKDVWDYLIKTLEERKHGVIDNMYTDENGIKLYSCNV